MLVPIVFILAFLAALATSLLQSGLAAAKTTLATSVARYSDAAMSDGIATFTAGLARYVALHGSRGPWPTGPSHAFPRAVCDAAPTPHCPYFSLVDATLTGVAGGASTGKGLASASNLQTSAIAEGRISAVVTVTIATQDGTVLGTRTRLLTYRVFEAAPFAVVSGVRDTATAGGLRTDAQGDAGGLAPSADGAAVMPQDTRIHVVLTCASAGAAAAGTPPANDGLPWGNAGGAAHEAPCQTPALPADAFADGRWQNGNANGSGWTQ